MAFPLWPLLYFLLVPSTWAGPLSTGSLTPTLQQTIPYCAHACLEIFIADSFPASTCGPPPNFDCLCTSGSTSGLTVGEGALGCLFTSNCGEVTDLEAASVYDVCVTVENAKPNTHGTLTATILPPAPTSTLNSASQTSSQRPFSTFLSAPAKSSPLSTTVSSANLGFSTRITSASVSSSLSSSSSVEVARPTNSPVSSIITSTTSAASSASSATGAALVPASSPAPSLTKPQVAGITVASIGAAAIGFGLCFLVFCLRRRRNLERPHSSSSFGDKIISSQETTPDMAAIAARDFESEHQPTEQRIYRQRQQSPTRRLRLETPASSSEDGWGQYQKHMAPEQIGLALGPQAPRSLRDEHSPITPASNRTRNSQLLPDKPTYSLFPPPLRTAPRNSIPNQVLRPPGNSPRPAVPPLGSPFARSAPQHPSSIDTSQTHLQGSRVAGASNPDPFTDTPNRSAPDAYSPVDQSRPQPPPTLTRRDRADFRMPSWELPPSAGVVRKPVPAYQAYRAQAEDSARTQNAEHQVAAIDTYHRRKPSRQKSTASRPMTFFSTGSETSFESFDGEDDEAPDPRSALSPVAEVRSPPIGRVNYPPIPVSASESPTRRPRETTAYPANTDSLLSKRLGQDKAKEIADRLQGASRQPGDDDARHSAKWKILVSPGQRGIDKSASPPSSKSALKSPPTPWRR